MPPVGKSGPGRTCINSSISAWLVRLPAKTWGLISSGAIFWGNFLPLISGALGSGVTLVFLMRIFMAVITSDKLWGGILVAIPTAMPSAPIRSKLGRLAGKTVGSFWEPSKLSINLTVSLSISSNSSWEILASRASV